MGKFIIKRFQLAGFDPITFIFEQGGHLDLLLRFLELARLVRGHLFVKKLFALLEGLLVELAVFLGLLELESRHIDFEYRVSCIGKCVRLRLDDGRILTV